MRNWKRIKTSLLQDNIRWNCSRLGLCGLEVAAELRTLGLALFASSGWRSLAVRSDLGRKTTKEIPTNPSWPFFALNSDVLLVNKDLQSQALWIHTAQRSFFPIDSSERWVNLASRPETISTTTRLFVMQIVVCPCQFLLISNQFRFEKNKHVLSDFWEQRYVYTEKVKSVSEDPRYNSRPNKQNYLQHKRSRNQSGQDEALGVLECVVDVDCEKNVKCAEHHPAHCGVNEALREQHALFWCVYHTVSSRTGRKHLQLSASNRVAGLNVSFANMEHVLFGTNRKGLSDEAVSQRVGARQGSARLRCTDFTAVCTQEFSNCAYHSYYVGTICLMGSISQIALTDTL